MDTEYLERILKARVYDVAIESPLERAPRLSRRLQNDVLFKREDLQPVFSFKLRGAYNRIAQLTAAEAERGVICASAGNHAQGVALSARRRGIPALIVMPRTTPQIKVQAVLDLGGEIELHGDDYDSACEHALAIARERGMTFVHPFDDPAVIAGQGTIAMEILRQHDAAHAGAPIDAIFVPVGGGGLIAGIAAYVKSLYPGIRIVGVEPADAASMYESLRGGPRVTLPRVGIFADGVAVRTVGEETFRLAQQYVDEIVLVSTDEICAAIQDIFEDTRAIAEPAGALAVAGLKKWVAREGRHRPHVRDAELRRQHELRPAAARRRARRPRPAARGAVRGRDPRGAGQLPAVLRDDRRAQRHRVQLPVRRPQRAHVFVGLAMRPAVREGRRAPPAGGGGVPGRRHDRQRGREAARALHGRRPRAGARRRAAVPLRVPGAARRAAALPAGDRQPLEHQPVPLPQPRRRLRPGAGRHPGARRARTPSPRTDTSPEAGRIGHRASAAVDDAAHPAGSAAHRRSGADGITILVRRAMNAPPRLDSRRPRA
jgi:threonine dehydratase